MKPVITVITVSYKGAKYLVDCIENVIAQECHACIEHLIIDGGSNDGTVEILQDYSHQFSHISWISEPDQGQSDAMNKGLDLAQADTVAFLNVDDRFYPETLKRWIKLIPNQRSPFLIVGNCEYVDGKGNHLGWNRPSKVSRWSVLAPDAFPFPGTTPSYCYSKVLHKDSRIGYYNIENHLSMDFEFLAKVRQVIPFTYFDEPWGVFVRHEACKTVVFSKNGDQRIATRSARRKILLEQPLNVKLAFLIYCVPKIIWNRPIAIARKKLALGRFIPGRKKKLKPH